jgi:DNA-binding SARP family transcriptional activator
MWRRLIELAPYRETGYRILMEALEQRTNNAEALLVYDRLRVLLRDELGVAPSPWSACSAPGSAQNGGRARAVQAGRLAPYAR